MKKITNPGYHVTEIKRGKIGELSKIQEELDEAMDATLQNSKIMVLVELSDLIGAVDLHLQKYFPGMTIGDLRQFSRITQRAFKSGRRK